MSRELAKIIYDALMSVAKGIAKEYHFGEYKIYTKDADEVFKKPDHFSGTNPENSV